MCLGIPMQVLQVDGLVARCHAKGMEREVSLFMLGDHPVIEGDFVMVHAGYAIRKVPAGDARTTWELLDEMFAAENSHA